MSLPCEGVFSFVRLRTSIRNDLAVVRSGRTSSAKPVRRRKYAVALTQICRVHFPARHSALFTPCVSRARQSGIAIHTYDAEAPSSKINFGSVISLTFQSCLKSEHSCRTKKSCFVGLLSAMYSSKFFLSPFFSFCFSPSLLLVLGLKLGRV